MKSEKYSTLFLFALLLAVSSQPITAQRRGGGQRPGGGINRQPMHGGATERTRPNINNNNINNRDIDRNRNINNASRNSNNTNISGNTVNVNVDRSHDVNVVNNRNTVVQRNNIATYRRPPYVYGGARYYCYHPYVYHPYRPYYWGPAWHPWGFFVAALTVTAIVVTIENEKYHYDQGVWYAQSGGGYTVVQAPVGGTVTTIPSNSQTTVVNNVTNYYYGGAYYQKDGTTYKVVPPPAGAVVENLPEGGEEVKVGDQTYVKIGETYYQPVQVDGKNKYEVVQVESEKS
ncbi:hypothetical protein A4H97_12405 [Niastella yeongjuensis]|uniref:DUF3300 domain-containing protein n=1 Tax=Niastella yeongjuensis TaxID=354355 RepID=A0A1V9E9Y8_9BACT|nr:DUF6515 family protein [Niastella yeongjuensis]OQP42947.1 hypothetical protein A4H97_12405 [Niastella yeongjuensis]SEO60544.1 hypothetical protein SAMN05660816_03149 [Niastella yeongjuensis]